MVGAGSHSQQAFAGDVLHLNLKGERTVTEYI